MRNITISIMVFFIIAIFAYSVYAQTVGNKVQNFDDQTMRETGISSQQDVYDIMQDYLYSKSTESLAPGRVWQEGNNVLKDGRELYLSLGSGIIQASKTNKQFIISRIIAFEKAVLEAKGKMGEYFKTEIESELKLSIGDGKEKGIAPNSKTGMKKSLKAVNSEAYRRKFKTAAKSKLIGCQVFRSFEVSPIGSKGEIGVILVHSDRLLKMAESLYTGKAIKTTTKKKLIEQKIPTDPIVLLTCFGVQQTIDENGNLVLVSYGQEGPKTRSKTSLKIAHKKAKMRAMKQIRQFAGEQVSMISNLVESETYEEFEDETEKYKNNNYFQQVIEAHADALKISNMKIIHRWNAHHPLTGNFVTGVVITWSPQLSDKAVNMNRNKERMNTRVQILNHE